MPLWRCCLSLFLVSGYVVAAAPLDAQSSDAPATVSGAVSDPSGARIPRASIHIHSNKLDRDTTTNGTGVFSITLPNGDYKVTAQATGFRALTRDLAVEAGEHRDLNFRLAIDAAAEVI